MKAISTTAILNAMFSVLAVGTAADTIAATSTVQATVKGTADIFDAGDSSGGARGGTLPVEILLPKSPAYIEISSVSGTTVEGAPPDGHAPTYWIYGTNIFSADGISGIMANTYSFLAGVFLTNAGSVEGKIPPRLDFRDTGIGTDFQEISPQIGQTFFIGDGRTGAGDTQKFYVPQGATRLYLGIADAYGFGWYPGHDSGEPPSSYADNGGAFDAHIAITFNVSFEASQPLGVSTQGLTGKINVNCVNNTTGAHVSFRGSNGVLQNCKNNGFTVADGDSVTISVGGKTTSFIDNRYEVLLDCGSWSTCQSAAESKGGHLLILESLAEQNFVYSKFKWLDYAWIALSDKRTEGSWLWTDGTLPSFSNWATGEPKNQTGTEDCAAILSSVNGKWKALSCSAMHHAIMEYDH